MSTSQKHTGLTLVPWYRHTEWTAVCDLVLSDSPCDHLLALRVLRAWRDRGPPLPAAVTGTLELLAALHDPPNSAVVQAFALLRYNSDKAPRWVTEARHSVAHASRLPLRLIDGLQWGSDDFDWNKLLIRAYGSMVLDDDTSKTAAQALTVVRFLNIAVNTDRKQGTFTASAKAQSIPNWLIQLRHNLSHDSAPLPTLPILDEALRFLLDWVRERYWSMQRPVIADHHIQPGDIDTQCVITDNLYVYFWCLGDLEMSGKMKRKIKGALPRGLHRAEEERMLEVVRDILGKVEEVPKGSRDGIRDVMKQVPIRALLAGDDSIEEKCELWRELFGWVRDWGLIGSLLLEPLLEESRSILNTLDERERAASLIAFLLQRGDLCQAKSDELLELRDAALAQPDDPLLLLYIERLLQLTNVGISVGVDADAGYIFMDKLREIFRTPRVDVFAPGTGSGKIYTLEDLPDLDFLKEARIIEKNKRKGGLFTLLYNGKPPLHPLQAYLLPGERPTVMNGS